MSEHRDDTATNNDDFEQPKPPSLDEWIQSFEELNESLPDWDHVEGWIRRHPAASIVGAFGTGVLLGGWLLPERRTPPRFSERVQATAQELGDEVRHRAGETGRNVSRKVSEESSRLSKEASEAASKTADSARKVGEDTFRILRDRAQENPEVARMIADAVVTAGATLLVRKLNSWADR